MQITDEQKALLNSLHCERVKNIDTSLLGSIEGAIIDKDGNRSRLVEHFRNAHHIGDDQQDKLASFVVMTPNDDILLFFSIRCGELFENVDERKMIIGHNAFWALQLLYSKQPITKEQRDKALLYIQAAMDEGMSIDEFKSYASKKKDYIEDFDKEPSKEVSRVFRVYPGAELKFFGANGSDQARNYWKSLNLPRKIGETLFWQFIVDKYLEIRKYTGCQYLYLFAADQHPDGDLVTYYKTQLHIDASIKLSANKPRFDFESQFLYQDVEELEKQKKYFFDHFTPDDAENNV